MSDNPFRVRRVGPRHYILDDDGNPVPCDDLMAWASWMEHDHRRRVVAQDKNEGPDGADILVSTVFLGLDHNYWGGPPILYETLVFNGPLHNEMTRYNTRDEALAGHQHLCDRVKQALTKP